MFFTMLVTILILIFLVVIGTCYWYECDKERLKLLEDTTRLKREIDAERAKVKEMEDRYFKLSGKHAELKKKVTDAAKELAELVSGEG